MLGHFTLKFGQRSPDSVMHLARGNQFPARGLCETCVEQFGPTGRGLVDSVIH